MIRTWRLVSFGHVIASGLLAKVLLDAAVLRISTAYFQVL